MSRPKKVLTIEIHRLGNGGGYSMVRTNHETGVTIGGAVNEQTEREIIQMLEDTNEV